MRRSPALIALSREHHGALVLAKRATEAGDGAAALAAGLREHFAQALAPHFRTEEADLIPLLAAAGLEDLVQRLLTEHEALYRLAQAAAADARDLPAFGQALADHVRFEERVLFPALEALTDSPNP